MAAAPHWRKERRCSVVSIYCVWLAALVVRAQGDCGPPKQMANAFIKNENPDGLYTSGSTVTYVCNETQGYVQSPGLPDTITCVDGTTWSEIQEFCQRSCKVPTRFDFAEVLDRYIDQNVFPVGTNVTYKCRPGYVPAPARRKSNTLTCLDTLEWSTIPEFCDRKDCGNPGEPDNGGVKFEGDANELDTKFGSSVTFYCNPGFSLLGRNRRTCTSDGWSNAVSKCEAVICSKPPDIKDGTHSSEGQEEFQYQTGVTYNCNSPKLWLIGPASIHCTQYGNWSGPAPECKAISCTSPDIPNGKRISGFGTSHTYKDSITFECSDGFVMNGSNIIRCDADNEWHPPVPTCRASVVTCGNPPNIVNGEHSSQPPFHVGTSVTFHCKSAEFQLHGEPTIHCQRDGTWSSSTAECRDEVCEMPNIRHGKSSLSSSNNRIIEITCDSLYSLNGESKLSCGEDKQWNPAVPECHLSAGPIVGIILIVLVALLLVCLCCYCYNKKKHGSYPTNEEKSNGHEAIHLKDQNQDVNA